MADSIQEKVFILGKEFMIACPPEARDALYESARLLDRKMREIKEAGKVIGTERIAVMAALNFAHELLELRQRGAGHNGEINERLRAIQDKIETVLDEEDRQMKL